MVEKSFYSALSNTSQSGQSISVHILVKPNAPVNAILGIHSENDQHWLKVALRAQSVEGKANDALVRYIAEYFELSRQQIEITHGSTAKKKRVIISQVDASLVTKLHNLAFS